MQGSCRLLPQGPLNGTLYLSWVQDSTPHPQHPLAEGPCGLALPETCLHRVLRNPRFSEWKDHLSIEWSLDLGKVPVCKN